MERGRPPRPLRRRRDLDAARATRSRTSGSRSRWAPTRPICRRDSGAMPKATSRPSARCGRCRSPTSCCPATPAPTRRPRSPGLSQERWEEILDRGIAEMDDPVGPLRGGRGRLPGRRAEAAPAGPLLPGGFPRCGGLRLLRRPRSSSWSTPRAARVCSPSSRSVSSSWGGSPSEPAAVLLTSCDPARTAGLRDLVEACHPQVVVAAAGQSEDQGIVPGRDGHPRRGGIARSRAGSRSRRSRSAGEGRHRSPTGSAGPARPSCSPGGSRSSPKIADGRQRCSPTSRIRGPTLDYLVSVYRLGETKPDLWLPAVPVDGQNANLYDTEWHDILADNYRVGYRSLMGSEA